MIGGTATATPQRMVHIAFHANRVEHYPQTQRGLPAHAIGYAMAGITARTEHHVPRLKRDIIHPLAITPAPRAQILNRQTVRIPVLVAQQIHALGRAMVGITARMEHRVPRLVRDIIPRREQTPAPHVQMVRQTVHTLVPAVRPIHVHTPATTVITNNLPRT